MLARPWAGATWLLARFWTLLVRFGGHGEHAAAGSPHDKPQKASPRPIQAAYTRRLQVGGSKLVVRAAIGSPNGCCVPVPQAEAEVEEEEGATAELSTVKLNPVLFIFYWLCGG